MRTVYGIFMLVVCALILLGICYRIDLADRLNCNPYAYSRVNYDTAEYDIFAFYTDELNYFNRYHNTSLLDSYFSELKTMIVERKLFIINYYSYYIRFLDNFLVSWKYLFVFTGFLSFLIFTLSVMKFTTIKTNSTLFILLLITFSPTVLQVSISWLRDLFIIAFMLFSIYASEKRNLLFWFVVVFLISLLRLYMVPVAIFAWFFFTNNKGKKKIWSLAIGYSLLALIVILFLHQYITFYGIETISRKLLPRVIQNFTGLTYGFLKGYDIPTLKGNLGDLSVLGYYYLIITYMFFYSIILHKQYHISNLNTVKKWLVFTLTIGIYISVLHVTAVGFFTNRIVFITWILAMITLLKLFQEERLDN